ncbi:Guanylate kinase [Fasciola gigantica]|uniref:guanylate kinase n=1 Tax=Fasciola gigantica TaxID=46835 RepID=A0A504YCZ1_FASGI|nr:Guanylate kinase [Fasciola gigantica]
MNRSLVIVFSGPSGAGKSTLLNMLVKQFPGRFAFSVSHTTRTIRPGEVDGKDYHFIEKDKMLRDIAAGKFLEHAEFAGNVYGTSRAAVQKVLDSGSVCILDVELEGVKSIHALKPPLNARYILVRPPSIEALEKRLRDRGTETEETLQKRLDRARKDIEFAESDVGRSLYNKDTILLNYFIVRRKCLLLSVIALVLFFALTLWHLTTDATVWLPPSLSSKLVHGTPKSSVSNGPMYTSDIDWFNPGPQLADLSDNGTQTAVPISYAVHVFYYAWYNSPELGKPPTSKRHWVHWNHPRIPHWIGRIAQGFSTKPHEPPEDVASTFLPKLGLYASADENVIQAHLRMLRFAGVGVLVLSWYPAGMADSAGEPVDQLVSVILNHAVNYGIKVALHIEPYKNRTALSVRNDLVYAYQKGYTSHPAFYKVNQTHSKDLPVFFVYDSYNVPSNQWSRVLTIAGDLTIRNKPEDAYMIGLLIDSHDCEQYQLAGFNGGYTYFVSEAATFASTSHNWMRMVNECQRTGIHFYPTIGPGYDDSSVRPWNDRATVDREDGSHFQRLVSKLPLHRVDGVGITSFNEWHEGTQIEPAAVSVRSIYADYSPFSEEFYLRMVRKFVNRYAGFTKFPWAFFKTTQSELDAINQF